MLDKVTYEPLAYLSGLCDINGEELLFDYYKGSIRKSPIYSADEPIDMAE